MHAILLQPTSSYQIPEAGKQLQHQGALEGTSGVLVVVLPSVAVFIVVLLVVLFVTIRHTSRVQRYLFTHTNAEAENAQLQEDIELR